MADIGTAYVKIEPTAKGITGKLKGEFESAGNESGNSFGGKFGSALSTAMGGVGNFVAGVTKVAVGATAAATTAVAGLATAAVSSYANYEQLVGGVEKLYGDAAGAVQKFADQAYLTSGMSANQYMETATSFSASLIGSLNGDVQKAAEMTDLAMRSMSDNVNVFGSDAQAVQNAYQGFAKQNYTMLDNLKLGYGGTKQEMQRLINDANKWAAENGKAANLTIDSFADVVTAIDYIQQSQNIAGTTGAEAMKTIEGSATATKAAWENVITAIGRGEGIQSAFDGLITAIFGEGEGEGLLNQIIPRIQTVLEGIGSFITQAAPMFADKIPEIINAVLPSLLESGLTLISSLAQSLMDNIDTLLFTAGDIIEMFLESLVDATANGDSIILGVIESILGVFEENFMQFIDMGLEIFLNIMQGMTSHLEEIIHYATEIIQHLVESLITYAPELIKAAGEIMLSLTTGIADALPELIPTVVEVVLTIVENLIDNVDLLIDAAIELIMGLAEGLINALPVLIEKAPVIVQKLVEAIIRNVPKLMEAAGTLVGELLRGIIQNLPKMLEAGMNIITEVQAGIIRLLYKIREAGVKAVENVWEGIKSINPIEWGKDMIDSFIQGIKDRIAKVGEAAREVANTVKDILGFSEPKKGPLSDFHTYAPDMMELFAQGVKQNEGIVQKQLKQSFDFMPYQEVMYQTTASANYTPVEVPQDDGMLTRIEGLLAKYLPNIGNDLYLDTGALVGGTTNKYNDALGKLAIVGAVR